MPFENAGAHREKRVAFALFITEGSEFLRTDGADTGGRSPRQDLPLLGVTSAFIKALRPIAVQALDGVLKPCEVYRAMLQVYGTISRDADGVKQRLALLDSAPGGFSALFLYDQPYYPPMARRLIETAQGPWCEHSFWFLLEGLALRRAVTRWLTPKPAERPGRYLTPAEAVLHDERAAAWPYRTTLRTAEVSLSRRLCKAKDELSGFLQNTLAPVLSRDEMSWLERCYTRELFNERTRQAGVAFPTFVVMGKKLRLTPTHSYHARGLFPLAWAEIMWAIDRGLYAHTCDVCGGVFALRPPYKRATYLCSPECERKRKIERMGGLEAFRTYNREAQKQYRERMRARKERTQNAEEES